jgi:hypothetical protein
VRFKSLLIFLLFPTFALASESTGAMLRFEFPGSSSKSSDAHGRMVVAYRRLKDTPYGGQIYQFRLSDTKHHVLDEFNFERSVAGAWGPNPIDLYVNNYIGSNITDCLVLMDEDGKISFRSLTAKLDGPENSKALSDLKIPKSTVANHFYLTCAGWLPGGWLALRVKGDMDDGTKFAQSLVFSRSTGSITAKAP